MMNTMKNFATKVISKEKAMLEKTVDFINEKISIVDSNLARKSILSQKGVSDNAKLIGTKQVSIKTFNSQLRNARKYGLVLQYIQAGVEFTPAHRALDFLMSHHFNFWMFYSKKLNRTYVLIIDEGFINWRKFMKNDDDLGTCLVFDGIMSFDDFMENKKCIKLTTKLYFEKKEEMNNYKEDDAA